MVARKIMLVLASAIIAGVMMFSLVACGGESKPAGGNNSSAAASSSAANTAVDAAANTVNEVLNASANKGTTEPVSPSELATVDVKVAFGDYDAMSALSKDIQNGKMDDKVVEIDGVVSNFSKNMPYSVVENKADGTGNIGTVFVIDGADDKSYPLDKSRVKIRGVVRVDSTGLVREIHTLPEFVEVAA